MVKFPKIFNRHQEAFQGTEEVYKKLGSYRTIDSKAVVRLDERTKQYEEATDEDGIYHGYVLPPILKRARAMDLRVDSCIPALLGSDKPRALKIAYDYFDIHSRWKTYVLEYKRMVSQESGSSDAFDQTPDEYLDDLEFFAEDTLFPSARKVEAVSWNEKTYIGSYWGMLQLTAPQQGSITVPTGDKPQKPKQGGRPGIQET